MLGDNTLRNTPGSRSLVRKDRAGNQEEKQKQEIDAIRGEVQKLVEIQKIVEEDENLGIPEAQAALEVIHHFNEDMSTIESNMRTLVQLMEQMSQDTER